MSEPKGGTELQLEFLQKYVDSELLSHFQICTSIPGKVPLDPNKINSGGKELEDAIKRLISNTKNRNHIYCSGHGLLPSTPIKNVERVIEIIKN